MWRIRSKIVACAVDIHTHRAYVSNWWILDTFRHQFEFPLKIFLSIFDDLSLSNVHLMIFVFASHRILDTTHVCHSTPHFAVWFRSFFRLRLVNRVERWIFHQLSANSILIENKNETNEKNTGKNFTTSFGRSFGTFSFERWLSNDWRMQLDTISLYCLRNILQTE